MHIGICNNTGLVYEGLGAADIPSVPTPSITQAKLIAANTDWQDLPRGLAVDPLRWIFREDAFDPVTRTRRGRLYEPQPGQGQPNQQRVGPHPYEDPMMRQVGAGGRVAKTLYTFTACHPLLNMTNRGEGMTLALGESKAASHGRIIQTEALANGSVMVTLKSLSAFGIIPAVDYGQVAPEHRPAVGEAIERVLNSAFRETPTSVVDHCRAALTILLSRWLVQSGHESDTVFGVDLGDLAKKVEKLELYCVAKAAQIVALLHNRGKPNVKHYKGFPTSQATPDRGGLRSKSPRNAVGSHGRDRRLWQRLGTQGADWLYYKRSLMQLKCCGP